MNIINVRAAIPPRKTLWPDRSRIDSDLALDLYRRLGTWPRVAEVLRGPHGQRYRHTSISAAVHPPPYHWRRALLRFTRMAVELQRQEQRKVP